MTSVAPAFHELTFVPEGAEVVVGRKDTGEYVVLPADGASLLRHMIDGASPAQAADWFAETFGEPVDIDEFLATLDELGFVRRAGETAADSNVVRVRFQRLGKLLFAPATFIGYAALFVAFVIVLSDHHDLFPRPGQVFFTSSLVAVQLTITFGQLPLVFLHEAFHALAGRRLGLPSRLGVSNRLMYIVFETKMNTVMSVPRRQRYLPFLAGMICDLVQLSALDIFAQATRQADGALSLPGRIALGFAFTVVMRLAWQFQFYLRTDLYYVLATRLNCYDLHAAGVALLRNRVWRWLARPHRAVDEQRFTERDRRIGTWYGPLVVFGMAVSIVVALYGSLPVAWEYVTLIAQRISSGRFDEHFFDGLFSMLMNVFTFTTMILLVRRKQRATRAATVVPAVPVEDVS